MKEHDLGDVVAAIEALPPGEVLATPIPYGVPAHERATVLSDLQRVVDELRRRGHRPEVIVRRTADAEVHGIALKRAHDS